MSNSSESNRKLTKTSTTDPMAHGGVLETEKFLDDPGCEEEAG